MDIRGLAYVVAQHRDPAVWGRFGERVLGMQALPAPGGALWLKMDERACRIVVEQGAESRYLASGWELPDAEGFERALQALEAAQVQVHRASEALRARRDACPERLRAPDGRGA